MYFPGKKDLIGETLGNMDVVRRRVITLCATKVTVTSIVSIGDQGKLELEVQCLLCDLPVAERIGNDRQSAGNGERGGQAKSIANESHPDSESA